MTPAALASPGEPRAHVVCTVLARTQRPIALEFGPVMACPEDSAVGAQFTTRELALLPCDVACALTLGVLSQRSKVGEATYWSSSTIRGSPITPGHTGACGS